MPDQVPQSFEHSALEADIKMLSQEVKKYGERPESKNLSGQELLKQAIHSLSAADDTPQQQLKTDSSKSPLPAYAQNASAEVKLEIEYLLDLALHQGISKAISTAQNSPYFVQDAFHDALAGRLYPELQKRGIVK